MQPARPTLPEFHCGRPKPVPSPMRWSQHLTGAKLRFKLIDAQLEKATVVDHLALRRSPGPDPAPTRPIPEIVVRFFNRNFLHLANHPDLPLQVGPEPAQGSLGIYSQIRALVRLIIGKKDKAARIKTAEQDDPCRRQTVRICGSQGHGIRLRHLGFYRLIHPSPELGNRITGHRGFIQFPFPVIIA